MMTNSSPPRRATVSAARAQLVSRCATATRKASSVSWPRLSLTTFEVVEVDDARRGGSAWATARYVTSANSPSSSPPRRVAPAHPDPPASHSRRADPRGVHEHRPTTDRGPTAIIMSEQAKQDDETNSMSMNCMPAPRRVRATPTNARSTGRANRTGRSHLVDAQLASRAVAAVRRDACERWAVRLYLIGVVALIGVYPLLSGVGRESDYLLVKIVGVAAVGYGLRRARRGARLPWWMLFVAVIGQIVG